MARRIRYPRALRGRSVRMDAEASETRSPPGRVRSDPHDRDQGRSRPAGDALSVPTRRTDPMAYPPGMPAPLWLGKILGWKSATAKSRARCMTLFGEPLAPNIADVGSIESLRLAGEAYRILGIERVSNESLADTDTGSSLEILVSNDLDAQLGALDESRKWQVRRGGLASTFAQFQHLAELQRLLDEQPTLRATVGHDYQVKTDVYVGLPDPRPGGRPFLHAAISCKWTIRSDRVQNVRHEFNTLVKSRRGRLPHLVLVTAEPLPSRVISIARGTGEVDAVYHLLFDEISSAVASTASDRQLQDWEEMLSQGRLRPYHALAQDLTLS